MTLQQVRIESLLAESLLAEPVLPERVPRRGASCGCDDSGWPDHHDRLLRVETDLGELVELLEMAVTWGELDWSRSAVVPPHRWVDFALCHSWVDPARMERIFSLATDVAARSAGGAGFGADVIGR